VINAWRRVRRAAARAIHGPRISVVPATPLVRLGTPYGGWTFLNRPELHRSTLVSCGLGEDASFDVAFAARFGAIVRMVDPTPRAIMHFEAISQRIGLPATQPFVAGGKQPVEAYDLSRLSREQLELLPVAVSDRAGEARFFAPSNPADVSHSLLNFQNDYATDTRYIVVATIPIETAFEGVTDSRTVLKLDIEGAETVALTRLAASDIRPDQVLVEFDELSRPSARSRAAFEQGDGALRSMGYLPIHFDGRTCVSYVRSDLLEAPEGRATRP
jgi:FkbM family methyltransferase